MSGQMHFSLQQITSFKDRGEQILSWIWILVFDISQDMALDKVVRELCRKSHSKNSYQWFIFKWARCIRSGSARICLYDTVINELVDRLRCFFAFENDTKLKRLQTLQSAEWTFYIILVKGRNLNSAEHWNEFTCKCTSKMICTNISWRVTGKTNREPSN